MKKKELKELRSKTAAEIAKMLAKSREELLSATKDIIESKEKNLRKRKMIRKEIAQILTIQGIIERETKKEENQQTTKK